MPACSADAAPWCGQPLLHTPKPEDLNHLTPEQVALYLEIAKTGIRLVRDDEPFDEVKQIFGRQVSYDKNDNEYTYARPELNGILFSIRLSGSAPSSSTSTIRFYIGVRKRLAGIDKQALEEQMDLPLAKKNLAINLDRQSHINFGYKIGMDSVSCYPVTVLLNYFKDEAYSTLDPRAEQEAKYLGPVLIERAWMTPEETMVRARRVPQCRSRQPAPRSGLWKPTIPHDVPNAEYFKRHEAYAQRVQKGQPMLSVGIGSPAQEARVLWTWVGE
ncbi:hypothetical protein [Cupriavidus sp. USMAA2-4]|uniref:hypothetical protein n=1 Tax=Cupriavidus sp. USMAA2-4 TaxID=876364 RepID=UPI0012F4A6F6|nr:hypothetical protein [Cupriavidus sp. USMAA2-4]